MRFSIIILLTLLFTCCTRREIPPEVLKGVDSIALDCVPDKREGVCDYTLSLLTRNSLVIKGETSIPEVKKEIIDFLTRSGFTVTDSLIILPDESVRKAWGLVSVSVCNMMSKPGFSSEQVSQALMGTPVRILKISGGWMLIQTPDHYLGWVTDSSIGEKDDAEMQAWRGSARVIYLNRAGDIIEKPDAGGIVSDITAGTLLEVTGLESKYYTVKIPDGRNGRVSRNDAIDFDAWISRARPDPLLMIPFAKSMTGFPYMWGGTSVKAVDCSGFVKTIYFMSGIILSRDASQQFQYGQPVDVSASLDHLQPGDLIFFGHLRDDGSKRITHVGMYIGDTEVIHSSGMVRINSLDPGRANYSSYLKQTMMGARRLIGLPGQPGLQAVNKHPWYFNSPSPGLR
jgi:hypothetical protein